MITITLSTKKQFAVYVLSLICLFFQQSTHAQHSTGYKLEHDGVIAWDFSRYLPDVVTICLGQNDGIQDSALFVGDYVDFLNRLRQYYPNSTFICLTSPMADDALKNYMQKMLKTVVNVQHRKSDKKVYSCLCEAIS